MLGLFVNCHEGYFMCDSDAVQARPIVVILGPTAGGKTGLSLGLAERLPGGGEIISADSMQVYRGMDIGTAKATEEERTRVVHHLIDIVEPCEAFTVEDWRNHAERVIGEVRGRGKWPIVVGGTNLYIKVLLEGMFRGPGADAEFRASLLDVETGELHERLCLVDAEAGARIHRNDRKRIVRGLEVFHVTGKKISDLQVEWSDGDGVGRGIREDVVIIGLDWPVEVINQRINARVKMMMEAGFVDEVRELFDGEKMGKQAREALGYKQLVCYLRGEMGLGDAVERIKIETRRFSRKQRTWLRRFRSYPRSLWIPADQFDTEDIVLQALTMCLRNNCQAC